MTQTIIDESKEISDVSFKDLIGICKTSISEFIGVVTIVSEIHPWQKHFLERLDREKDK